MTTSRTVRGANSSPLVVAARHSLPSLPIGDEPEGRNDVLELRPLRIPKREGRGPKGRESEVPPGGGGPRGTLAAGDVRCRTRPGLPAHQCGAVGEARRGRYGP